MKLNILFVDDEANVINGLKRMLRSLKEDWEFFFALSGTEALEMMHQKNMDVVVSDMRMPNMNGAELLEITKEKYPSTIRIILSGQSNEELALKSTRSAHQFISKPFEPEKLKQTIQKTYNLHKFLDDDSLRKVINGLGRLPSIPKTFFEIEDELGKESFSLQKITEIIRNDLVMSAKILHIVNSAFFGLAKNISDINHAVNILGANTIKSLIIYAHVFKSYKGSAQVEQMLKDIWEHSLRVAKGSKNIVATFGDSKSEADAAYMSGLLHDIGKIIIVDCDKYRNEILSKMELENLTYNEAEKYVFGTTHAEIGAYLLRLWGLPEIVTEAVLHHHDANRFEEGDINILTAVHLANVFVESSDIDEEFIKKNGLENKLAEIIMLCKN
jgi:putative nucleotidyltransferase with HDIG domain